MPEAKVRLPIGVSRKLDKYKEEFPKGKVLGPWTVIGRCAVVWDDGVIKMRVRHESGKEQFKTIRGLRSLRTRYGAERDCPGTGVDL